MIDIYKTPEDEREGIGIWLNHFGTIEDHYLCLIKTKEYRNEQNNKRKKRFAIFLTFFLWEINIIIPLKTIGKVYYGRKMK